MCVIGSFLALVLAGATEPPAATESADALKHFQQAGKYSKQHQGEALLVMQGGKVLFDLQDYPGKELRMMADNTWFTPRPAASGMITNITFGGTVVT